MLLGRRRGRDVMEPLQEPLVDADDDAVARSRVNVLIPESDAHQEQPGRGNAAAAWASHLSRRRRGRKPVGTSRGGGAAATRIRGDAGPGTSRGDAAAATSRRREPDGPVPAKRAR